MPGPPDAADPGEARAAMRQERVDERPLRVAGRRMHDHPRRLVDDDQVRVLEADVERDRLRLRLGGFGFRQEHGDDRAGSGARCRVAQHPAAAFDAPVEDQLLQAAARQLRQKLR